MRTSVTPPTSTIPFEVMTPDTPILTLELSDCTVNLNRLEILRNGDSGQITPTEGKLLEYLAKCKGRAIKTEELLQVAFGYREGITSTAVKNTVYRLRKKIEREPDSPQHLITVRGFGYRLEDVSFETQSETLSSSRQGIRYSNIPSPSRTFIGREEVLKTLLNQFKQDGCVVTLVGPGGIGKTFVAMEVGRQSTENLIGGSWFCDLRMANDFESLIQCLEEGLEIEPTAEECEERLSKVGKVLMNRGPSLIILDNAEHIAEHLAPIVSSWHKMYPTTRILITSQQPIHLPEEHMIRLGVMPIEEGVRLFAARSVVKHRTAWDEPALHQLVAALDGLPLALEMAAKWTDVLSPQQLLDRSDERFELLRSAQSNRHQQTLESVIARSWNRVAPEAQAVLRQCARFVGGFSFAMAESIIQSAEQDRPISEILRSLLDKSLLFSEMKGRQRRLYLHQSVQLFIHQLDEEDEELESFWLKHGAYFSTFGEVSRLDSFTMDKNQAYLDDMLMNVANMMAARTQLIALNRPNLAAKCTLALCFVLTKQNRANRCYALCHEVIQMADIEPCLQYRLLHVMVQHEKNWRDGVDKAKVLLADLGETESRLRGRIWASIAALQLSNFELDAFEPSLREALPLAIEHEDLFTEAIVRRFMGVWYRLQGQHKQALAELNHALIVSNGFQKWCHPEILSQLGRTYFMIGRIRDSLNHFEQIVTRFGAENCGIGIHESIATLHVILGQRKQAKLATERMIQLQVKDGNPLKICPAMSRQAGPLCMEGKFSQALACVEDSLQRGKIIGVSSDWLLIMAYDRADIMVKMNHPEALEAALSALKICEEKSHTMIGNCLLAVARAHRCQNNSEKALVWAQKSLAVSQKRKSMLEKLRALLVSGLSLVDLGRISEAQKTFDQAQPLWGMMSATPHALVSIWEKELEEALESMH